MRKNQVLDKARKPPSRKVTITAREDYLKFIEDGVKRGDFNSRSHAFAMGIKALQKKKVFV